MSILYYTILYYPKKNYLDLNTEIYTDMRQLFLFPCDQNIWCIRLLVFATAIIHLYLRLFELE